MAALHVFQGRFKAILAKRERYLLELARYIAGRQGRTHGPPPRPALGAPARIEEPVFGPRATRQAGARCGNAPGVPGIRLHYGSRRAGSGHTLFDGEQDHQGGKMKTVITRPDTFFLR